MPDIPVTCCGLDDVNGALDDLRNGKVIGRMILTLGDAKIDPEHVRDNRQADHLER